MTDKPLTDILDEQFPKGKSKERGNALVLFAEFMIRVKKLKKRMKRPYTYNVMSLRDILLYIDKIFGSFSNEAGNFNNHSQVSPRSADGYTSAGGSPAPDTLNSKAKEPKDKICANCGHPEQNHLDHRFSPPRLIGNCRFPVQHKRGLKVYLKSDCPCKNFVPKEEKQKCLKK